MPEISQLEVNGTVYDICDATTRDSVYNNTYLLKGGTALTSSDDFNTLLTPGTYYIQGNSSTPQNGPTDNSGNAVSLCGKVIVEIPHGLASSNIRGQTIYVYSNRTTYYRRYENSAWSAWFRFPIASSTSATANRFLATPNGSTGMPSYRAIVADDLPSLSDTYLSLADGGTITANVTMNANYLYLKSGTIDRETATMPSSTQYGCHVERKDKNGNNIGQTYSGRNTNGRVYTVVSAVGKSGASNYITIGVNYDGTPSYTWKDGQTYVDSVVTQAALGSNTLTGNEYMLVEDVNTGGTAHLGTYRRRNTSQMWTYIKSKADAQYLIASGGTYGNPGTINRDASSVSDVIYANYLYFKDKDGENVTYFRNFQNTDKRIGFSIVAINEKTNGDAATNTFTVGVNKDGSAYYGFGSGDAATSSKNAFREALGIENLGKSVDSENGNNVTVANSTWTQLQSVSLTAGKYILIIGGTSAANSTGIRRFGLSSSATMTSGRTLCSDIPGSGLAGYCTFCAYVHPTTTTTYRLWGYQTSGGNLTMSTSYKYIQIV